MFSSFLLVFFFKQKTAYELRISDWSSDVCSSDLVGLWAPCGSNRHSAAHLCVAGYVRGAYGTHRRRAIDHAADPVAYPDRPGCQWRRAARLGAHRQPVSVRTTWTAPRLAVRSDGWWHGFRLDFRCRDRKSTRLNSSH